MNATVGMPSAFDLAFNTPGWNRGSIQPSADLMSYHSRPITFDMGIPNIPMPDVPEFDTDVGDNKLGTLGAINAGLSGLQTLGNLWGAWQQMKLAKKQFRHTKKVTDTNLMNSIQSYNTALADRGRSRAFTEGQSRAEADAYIRDNRLDEYKG